jgi:hypothetical protein
MSAWLSGLLGSRVTPRILYEGSLRNAFATDPPWSFG